MQHRSSDVCQQSGFKLCFLQPSWLHHAPWQVLLGSPRFDNSICLRPYCRKERERRGREMELLYRSAKLRSDSLLEMVFAAIVLASRSVEVIDGGKLFKLGRNEVFTGIYWLRAGGNNAVHISVNTLKVPMNIILLSSAFSRVCFSDFWNLSYLKPHNKHISFPYIDLYHIFTFSFGRLSYLKFYHSILHSIQGALS